MTKKETMMKQGVTIITRGVIYLMGIAILSVCAILLPELAREEAVGKVNPPSAYPFLLAAWVLSLPIFFCALSNTETLTLC